MKSPLSLFHWIPRIICIIDILFISMFAIDVFGADASSNSQLIDFLIHMIPSIFLIFILILAWKKELLGGLLFIIIGIILTPVIYYYNHEVNHSVQKSFGIIGAITFPFIVVGFLFIISAVLKEKIRMQKAR